MCCCCSVNAGQVSVGSHDSDALVILVRNQHCTCILWVVLVLACFACGFGYIWTLDMVGPTEQYSLVCFWGIFSIS